MFLQGPFLQGPDDLEQLRKRAHRNE
jgi:hypothetical protein